MADVVLLSHNDLDGVGSTLISSYVLRKSGLNIVDIKNVGNHEVDDTILTAINEAILTGNEVSILVTDITPSETTAELIDLILKQYPNVKLKVLDHHKHALPLNKYDWAEIVVERDGVPTSGTSLLVDFLFEQGYELDYKTYELAETVRLYDTWDWTRRGVGYPKRLNDLLYLIGHKKFVALLGESLELQVDDKLYPSEYDLLLDVEGERVVRYIDKKYKEISIATYNFGLDGQYYVAGFVIAEQYFSELGNELANKLPEVDLIVILDVAHRKASLRTNGDVDVSVIAKAKGGGGHPKAAGYPLTDDDLKLLLSVATNKQYKERNNDKEDKSVEK